MKVVLSVVTVMFGKRTIGKLSMSRGEGSRLEFDLTWKDSSLIKFEVYQSQLEKALRVFQ